MRVYIELDALIDTRLPVLENLVEKVDLDKYLTRDRDPYTEDIDKDAFQKAYSARDRFLINDPYPTPIHTIVKTLILEKTIDSKEVDKQDSVDIIVNLHPFKFSLMEVPYLERGISVLFHKEYNVKCIYKIPDKEILDYDIIVKYDGHAFINQKEIGDELLDRHRPHHMLVMPALMEGDKKPDIDDSADLFMLTAELYAPLIDARFIHPEYFSIDVKRLAATDIEE